MRKADNKESIFGELEFEGAIIETKIIKRAGRTFGFLCVKIKQSNVKDFYFSDKRSNLKIENGFATIPIGFLGEFIHRYGTEKLENSNFIVYNKEESGFLYFYKNKELLFKRKMRFDRCSFKLDCWVCLL